MYAFTRAAAEYAQRKKQLAQSRERLQREVLIALDDGVTEVDAARIAGVDRMTVRAWRAGVVVPAEEVRS